MGANTATYRAVAGSAEEVEAAAAAAAAVAASPVERQNAADPGSSHTRGSPARAAADRILFSPASAASGPT